jgi:hypothetical protein
MAMRELVGDDGRAWMVYAIVPNAYDDRIGFAPGYARGWLCYQCGGEKWRYLGIPDGWQSLGDVELLDLMDEAIPVRV